jgi:hypothetical protein
MSKVKITIQTESGIEELEADGILFTLFQDEETRVGYRSGYRGNVRSKYTLENILSNARRFVIDKLGIEKDVEENFDKHIRDNIDQDLKMKPNEQLNQLH